jgi:hypothetical protein
VLSIFRLHGPRCSAKKSRHDRAYRRGRGRGDFLGSHDLEDVVSVVDGRETLSTEVRDAGPVLSEYVRREIAKLLANAGLIDALPGFLLPDSASQSRIGIVLARLQNLASI